MSDRTSLILSLVAIMGSGVGAFFGLALLGASDQLLGFAYVMLLCAVAPAVSHVGMRYWTKHHQ